VNSTRDVVLAVDVGSTWCKAAYLDPAGRTVATGRAYTRDIPVHREMTLTRFWQACQDAVRAANAQLPGRAHPAAIGISTRALFGVCLDRAGAGYLPAWDITLERQHSPDLREAISAEVWGAKHPTAHGYAIGQTGLMLWLKRERPEEWRTIRRVGALHDYIVYQMTGAWVTDPTSGPGQLEWPAEFLALTGLPLSVWPEILEPHCVAGGLTKAAGHALGLPTGTPVVCGWHDGAAANAGVRAVEVGDTCLTLGTNFVLRAVNGPPLPIPATGYVVAPGRWAWVNNVPGAATQLDIVAQSLLGDLAEIGEHHARLGQLADEVAPEATGLVLDLIKPGREDDLRSAVAEARRTGYTDGAIYRAILEAVAGGVQGLLRRAQGHGARPQRFVATGGSAQNLAFVRVLTAVLGAPIEIGPPEGGILGAGMAAAVGAGWFAALDAAMTRMSTSGPIIQPDAVIERESSGPTQYSC
jgi:sugar (pentulose or hexulose) kinase